jgi:hypothetical protein
MRWRAADDRCVDLENVVEFEPDRLVCHTGDLPELRRVGIVLSQDAQRLLMLVDQTTTNPADPHADSVALSASSGTAFDFGRSKHNRSRS